jgi:hypothetical protein
MSRSRTEWTQAKFDRYIKEGRGQGKGNNYTPWIKVSDFSSKGRVLRALGWKTNREHHFFSDGEARLFYLFEWSDRIHDIREQFPLLDLDLCQQIAEDMGIKYPTDRASGIPMVLSTDFMLSVERQGKVIDEARTYKPSTDLNNKRTALKLEIERRYYAIKGMDWKLVTDKEVPRSMAANIKWVHSAYRLEGDRVLNKDNLLSLSEMLKSRLTTSAATVNKITTSLDKEANIELGSTLYLFQHLIARKEIVVDMLSEKPLSCISATETKVV